MGTGFPPTRESRNLPAEFRIEEHFYKTTLRRLKEGVDVMAGKSMTGFGRGEAISDGRIWTIELRSVNNRFLDLKMKLPRGYTGLEDRIRKKVGSIHGRGRVDLFCSVSGDFSDLVKTTVNIPVAKAYKEGLSQIAKELDLADSTDLSLLASFSDVLVREQESEDLEVVWPFMQEALDKALLSCNEMRCQEGKALFNDLSQRLQNFQQVVEEIEGFLPALLERREKTLNERLAKLLDRVQLEPQRLAQEVAILADKTDVTEEIVRLYSHVGQFQSFLKEEGPVGKKLDFLLQEFLREVNTMASKINDAEIAHLTVALKGELEKMREQVQNIE